MEISATGALIGLAIAVLLFIFKIAPCYALMLGALAGGLCGAVAMKFSTRLKLIPLESLIGVVLAVVSTASAWLFR